MKLGGVRMANSFYLQILSVNRLFYSGRCEALIFQEEDGERRFRHIMKI